MGIIETLIKLDVDQLVKMAEVVDSIVFEAEKG